MRVLLTGAAGFIGSHVCERLLERGDQVVAVDSLDAYYSPNRKRQTLAALREHPAARRRLHVHEHDVCDGAAMKSLLSEHDIDAIAHLAGLPGVRNSVREAQRYCEVNLGGTLSLLEAARAHRLRGAFVFASTSSVYGDTACTPFSESDPCDRPLAPYPASKRSAELYGYTYHHLHRLQFTALRFFTVYGPRNRPDMMAHMVLDHLYHGRRLKLFGDGQLKRDWTFVSDVAAGVVAALDRPFGYEIFNIGRGEPVLLANFIEQIEALAGLRAQFEHAPMPPTDMEETYADIERAVKLLDYRPRVALEEGARQLFEWYQTLRPQD